jgi:NTP pyrophosphatase (non-canonical NTP hydrolase)
MTLDEYQSLARRTLGDRTPEQQLANAALGLAGEAGEVAETIKKHLFHGRPLDRDAVVKEIGDCLWYVAAMATTLGVSLDEVGATNIDKLRRRYPDGFSAEASLRRVDQNA